MLVGGIQLLSCCDYSTLLVDPPEFPGEKKFHFTAQGSTSFNQSASAFYTLGSCFTPCHTAPIMAWDTNPTAIGYSMNLSVLETYSGSAMTGSIIGSYTVGIRQYAYGSMQSFTLKTKIELDIPTVEAVDAYVNVGNAGNCDESPPTNSVVTETYKISNETYLFTPAFGWLGVAQRDLPGIRLKVISGTDEWLFRVDGGVVTVYTDDGTKTFSTSGTLDQVATAINSSGISTWIQARCSGWDYWQNGSHAANGETNGNVASGLNEWDYVFTKNDSSSMLKDHGPTYIIAHCTDTLAPSGWKTSTRVPVYSRGDILPPRGIAYYTINAGSGGANPYLINRYYSTYPDTKFYDNTENGARKFITDPVYKKSLSPSTYLWGAFLNWNGFTGELDVAVSGFEYGGDLATTTRINSPLLTANQTINLYYNPVTLQIYNYRVLGICPWNTGPNCPIITSICQPDYDCLNLNCQPSGCFYEYGQPPLYTCSTYMGDCTLYFEEKVPGQLLVTHPPTTATWTNAMSVHGWIS